jgi:hypothetical protein
MASLAPPRTDDARGISDRLTVARLVAHLGADVLAVEAAPRGLELEITGLHIYDITDPAPIAAGELVAAVGVSTTDSDAVDLIERAGVSAAACVVMKTSARTPAWIHEAAEIAGTTVLGIPFGMSWQVFHQLATTAISSASELELVADTGSVTLGDVFALANAIAAMVGGAVTIDDSELRLMAFSSLEGQPVDETRRSSIIAAAFPDHLKKRIRHDGTLAQMLAGEVVGFDYFGDLPRLGVAIKAGDTLLGFMFVIKGGRTVSAEDETLLHEAARVAALHLLHVKTVQNVERRVRDDLLLSILQGGGSPDVLVRRLGLEPTGWFTVAAFEPVLEGLEPVDMPRARDLLDLYAQAIFPHAISASRGSVIYALLPSDDAPDPVRLCSVLGQVLEKGNRGLSVRLRAGIGMPVGDPNHIAHSRWEADQVLLVLAREPTRAVATFDDVRAHVLLLEVEQEVSKRPYLLSQKVRRMLEHDRVRATSYVDTLRAFLDSHGNLAAAAARVHVHPSTFRYRLQRLDELFGISLDDSTERLAIALELWLHDHPGPRLPAANGQFAPSSASTIADESA